MTDRHRLLVALIVEGVAAAEIDGLRRGLGGRDLARLAPHVTLVPPRNVRGDDLGGVLVHLEAVAASSRPFEVEIGPAATFAPERPVLYLAVAGDATLVRLQRDAALGPFVAPPDRPQRPFVPHVTLSSRIGAPEIGCAVTVLSGYRRPVTFSRIHLLEQQPGLPGRPWRIVAGRLLGGSSVVGRGGHELELTVLDRLDPGLEDLVAGMWERHGRDAYGEDWHPDEPFAIVARAGGRVVGAATGRTSGPTCECERLIVDPVTRGEGVGTRLLRHVERLAVERGCTVVRICTEDGGPAERFFSERGFVRSTLLPGWRNGADFVVMVRDVPGRQAPA